MRLGETRAFEGFAGSPHTDAAEKCVRVVPRTAIGRQPLQFVDVATSQDNILRFKRDRKTLDNVEYIVPPFLHAVFIERSNSDVVFEHGIPGQQLTEHHWLDNAVHEQGGAEACSKTEEEHFPDLVAAQRLHGSVVQHFDRPPECSFKIETGPPSSQIPGLRNRTVM